MKRNSFFVTILIIMIMALSLTGCGGQDISSDLDAIKADTAAVLQEKVSEPTLSSIGGEWTVIALAKSGSDIEASYYEDYYERVCQQVEVLDGQLSKSKYTEYARVSIALSTIGKDPANVSGYDLLAPLKDAESVEVQGIMGPVFALIAAEVCDYDLGDKTEQRYRDYIMEHEVSNGGFALAKGAAEMDVDVTAMVLQALAYYQDDPAVKNSTDAAVDALANGQQPAGGYEYSESNAQVIIALTALGIDPMEDDRFAGESGNLGDVLMTFQLEDGTFIHEEGGDSDIMATEQALCALDALSLFKEGKMFY